MLSGFPSLTSSASLDIVGIYSIFGRAGQIGIHHRPSATSLLRTVVQRGVIHLIAWSSRGLITSKEDEQDRGWCDRFIMILTNQVHRLALSNSQKSGGAIVSILKKNNFSYSLQHSPAQFSPYFNMFHSRYGRSCPKT